MAQLTHRDLAAIQTLANLSGQAYTAHALAPGQSESTVDSQHTKAIQYWQTIQSVGGLEAEAAVAVADAITHLQARQARLRNPQGATTYLGDRA